MRCLGFKFGCQCYLYLHLANSALAEVLKHETDDSPLTKLIFQLPSHRGYVCGSGLLAVARKFQPLAPEAGLRALLGVPLGGASNPLAYDSRLRRFNMSCLAAKIAGLDGCVTHPSVHWSCPCCRSCLARCFGFRMGLTLAAAFRCRMSTLLC